LRHGGSITGTYTGYLIRYDWSGQHAIGSSPLELTLDWKDGQLTGLWAEGGTATPLQAVLTPRALVFKHTAYQKTDHYSRRRAMHYRFADAQLQRIQRDGTVYLCGNIQMHSTERNEPEKPQYVALVRQAAGKAQGQIPLTGADGGSFTIENSLLAYPNPFTDVITVDFELKEACEVHTQVLTLEGNVVYANRAGLLQDGQYTLPIKPGTLAAGTYIVRLQCGREYKTTQVTKL
jgi:uncharacterized protein